MVFFFVIVNVYSVELSINFVIVSVCLLLFCKGGGLYNRLYLCLYDFVVDFVRLVNGDSILK